MRVTLQHEPTAHCNQIRYHIQTAVQHESLLDRDISQLYRACTAAKIPAEQCPEAYLLVEIGVAAAADARAECGACGAAEEQPLLLGGHHCL